MCGEESCLITDDVELFSHRGFEIGYNYTNSLNCTRTIEAPFGMKVELVAETIDLEYEERYEHNCVSNFNYEFWVPCISVPCV